MAWYRTGTITVTNGSATVTGSGTSWIANAAIGEGILAPDNRIYEIVNIASDTSITLGSAYLGSNSSGQSYVIVPTQSYIRDLASQAATLINNYSTIYNTIGQGKFAEGTLGAPAISFQTDTDTGFYHSAANEVTFVAGGVAQFKYNTSGLIMLNGGGFVNLTTSGNTTLGDASTDTVTINGTTTANAPVVIADNSANAALRITQVGSGNAILVEDSANPDSTPFVVNADGVVVVGASSAQSFPAGDGVNRTASTQIQGSLFSTSTIAAALYNTAASVGGATLSLAKSNNATVGSHSIVANGDVLGVVNFSGSDGTAFVRAANIFAQVDGTPGTNDMPGRLVFSTTRDGASSPTEAFRVNSSQTVLFGRTYAGSERIGIGGATSGLTTGTSASGIYNDTVVSSAQTAGYTHNISYIGTQAASFTLANLNHNRASQGVFGAGSTVTNQFGFQADASLTGATNNYGFYGNIAAGTGRWNFYAAGTADNVFAGTTSIGGTVGSESLRVTPVASAVNYLQVAGGATGSYTILSSQGSDTNVFTNYWTKGNGAHDFKTNGGSDFQFRIAHTASAVNYLNATGGATGNAVTLSAQGSDTNIPINITTKGTGGIGYFGQSHTFYGSGAPQLQVSTTASAVNYLQVTGAIAGIGPTFSAQGSDTNINMVYATKGTGVHAFYTGSSPQFVVASTASAVNYLQVTGGTTGNAATLSAQGSDTNIDLALTPKGTGNVKFGTFTANADAPITGYITIKDSAGNVRKLAVIA